MFIFSLSRHVLVVCFLCTIAYSIYVIDSSLPRHGITFKVLAQDLVTVR